ncbi:MAG: sulfite reductase subunit alpha [Pseudomonadota bacterium]
MAQQLPFIPKDAPFSDDQRSWLAGFVAGLKMNAATAVQAGTAANAQAPLDIMYGTQTGNAEAVAQQAAEVAQANGFAPRIHEMDAIEMGTLAQMRAALFVVSTYGEGEMPDNAQIFWNALSDPSAPRLQNLNYGVLALGDTSYDQFCQAGKLIDTRLEQLGAHRFVDRIDCDVDFEDPSAAWIETAVSKAPQDNVSAPVSAPVSTGTTKKSQWTRKNPYPAKVVENRLLSGAKSAKEIRHFSFDLADSGMTYEAGDALGVMPTNNAALVEAIIKRVGATPETMISGHDVPLAQLLTHNFEIRTPSKDLINGVEGRAGHAELSHVLAHQDKEALDAFLWGRDTLDLLNLNPKAAYDPQEFVSWLKPLQHRAYSISSSPKAHPGEVHLTVASVRWQTAGRQHLGVASTYLADMCDDSTTAPIFMSPNKSFRIPQNDDAPVVMVGPGTGIAPFRAFLEERQARGSSGKNWLFFGDQHRDSDFIYEEEIGAMSKDGVLTRLDLAFSRDQKDKIYVQDRMRENSQALYDWLEQGGYFYVCGDATRMAKDVDKALFDIVKSVGNLSDDGALTYINDLKRDKRYLRDVY